MSDIFTKLLAEDSRQQSQLQQPQEVFPPQSPTHLDNERRSDTTTLRRNDLPTFRPSDETTRRPNDVPTVRRITERAAFDLYQDQVQAIRRIRAERELSGEKKISLSDIAREAFEVYLRQKDKPNP